MKRNIFFHEKKYFFSCKKIGEGWCAVRKGWYNNILVQPFHSFHDGFFHPRNKLITHKNTYTIVHRQHLIDSLS